MMLYRKIYHMFEDFMLKPGVSNDLPIFVEGTIAALAGAGIAWIVCKFF